MKTQVRLKDVAAQAGVAVSTASMALADHPAISAATKSRVRTTCEALGYRGLDKPRRRQTGRRFAFVLFGASPGDEGYSRLVFELAAAAGMDQDRLEIVHFRADEPATAIDRRLTAVAAEGGILLLCGVVPPACVARLVARESAAIMLGHVANDAPPVVQALPRVIFDDVGMGRAATQRLLDRGHRRIGFVCAKLYPGLTHARFRDGYRLALLDAGQSLQTAWEGIADRHRDPLDSVAAACRALAEPPTAWVIPNAIDADAFRTAMAKVGVVIPDDALIIADTPGRRHQHRLDAVTAIAGRLDQFAEAAIALARRLADGDSVGTIATTIAYDFLEAQTPPPSEP